MLNFKGQVNPLNIKIIQKYLAALLLKYMYTMYVYSGMF